MPGGPTNEAFRHFYEKWFKLLSCPIRHVVRCQSANLQFAKLSTCNKIRSCQATKLPSKLKCKADKLPSCRASELPSCQTVKLPTNKSTSCRCRAAEYTEYESYQAAKLLWVTMSHPRLYNHPMAATGSMQLIVVCPKKPTTACSYQPLVDLLSTSEDECVTSSGPHMRYIPQSWCRRAVLGIVATTKYNITEGASKIRQTCFPKRNRIIFERQKNNRFSRRIWHLEGNAKLLHRFFESGRTR